MKLAIVMHSVVRGDGQGRVGYEIARYAIKCGVDVSLVADRVESDLINMGITWLPVNPRYQRPVLFKAWDFAKKADRVLAQLERQFDVVQGFGFVTRRPHHLSCSQFVHGAWLRSPQHIARNRRDFYGGYQYLYSRLNARWEAQSYSQARIVVACSHQVKKELISIGVPEERIKVILNAVDVEEFCPGPADRSKYKLPSNVPLAIFVGDIRTGRKNLDTVLNALVHVSGIHLAVVGTLRGSPFPDLAQRLGIAERVHFLGFRRDVAQIMRCADIYVFPSRYEPFGIVVLEALATGTPVITTSTVGASEIITPECGIVLSDPNDADVMGKALQTLAEDTERRKCMAQAARAIAEQHTWCKMANAYLKLYEEIGHP